jgi:ABC-type uncharacterized transport system permease subunit
LSDFWGQTVKRGLDYLPFTYTIGFPIRAATGNMPVNAVLSEILTQYVWILILAALSRLV